MEIIPPLKKGGLGGILKPESLHKNNIAGNHRPVCPRVRPECTVEKYEAFELASTVPCHEEFHRIGVPNHAASEEHDFVHIFKMFYRNNMFEFEHLPYNNKNVLHHRKAGKDRSGNKVWRENCWMPARQYWNCKVKAHDRMDGEHKRCGKSCKDEIQSFIVCPVTIRKPPAKTQERIDNFFVPIFCPIA